MTDPPTMEGLPPGPWTISDYTDVWWLSYVVMSSDGDRIAAVFNREEIARAIAAIPEMRAENNRLRAENAEMRALLDRQARERAGATQVGG
jgi:hypothetical protein